MFTNGSSNGCSRRTSGDDFAKLAILGSQIHSKEIRIGHVSFLSINELSAFVWVDINLLRIILDKKFDAPCRFILRNLRILKVFLTSIQGFLQVANVSPSFKQFVVHGILFLHQRQNLFQAVDDSLAQVSNHFIKNLTGDG